MPFKYNPITGELDVISTLTGTATTSFSTDSGSATPAAGVITVAGGTGISTSGAGSTVTVTLDTPVSVSNGGTGVADLTNNAILVGDGTSPVDFVGPLTNGQLPIGDSTGLPVAASLTAPAAGITITGGAGTITFALSDDLAGIEALGSTGMVSRTAADTYATRTITGTTDFIDVADGGGIAANPTLSIGSNFESTGMHGWNGSIIETVDVDVASDGAIITLSVQQDGGGDLTVVFSDGYDFWDTTVADTVTLTAGSDTSPTLNFVYFLQSTMTLTANTSGFPSAEHAPIATVLCQSAASLLTDGAYKVHVWTDHVTTTDDQGHISDLSSWIRNQSATWISGVSQTYTITTNGGAADNVILTTASGIVLQLHKHAFPAFSGTPDVYVVNDSVTPFNKVTDLNALLTDSTGATMSGRFFSLVIWGVVSEDAADCKLYCNLPGGSYNNQTGVEADLDNFANFTIPSDFKGTGFLISEWKLRHQVAASGTWTSIAEIDLRGLFPAVTAGGGTAPASEFVDNAFRILDDGDNTKEIAFEASGITTATTRTITMANQAVDLTPTTGTYQGSDATLTALAAYNTNGLLTQTAADTFDGRTITAGTGISVADGDGVSGNPTISASGGGIAWNEVTGTSDSFVADNGYIANNAGVVTITLPVTASVGEVFRLVGKGAGGWAVAQNASQLINVGSSTTTTGVGGSLASTNQFDAIEFLCITANTTFVALSTMGNITVV